MPFIILSLFLILTISLAGSLLYLKEYPFSKQTLRTIKCFSCIFILYIQIKEISNSNCMLFNYVDSILGLTLLLLYKFYYQNQNLASNLFHNQRPPSEVSEQVIKINEPELELPQNLPPIMSENESRSSSKDQQEPNTTGRFQQQQEKAESSFGNKAIQRQASKENQKVVSNLSFLGDFKQSNFQKSQLGQVPFIKQSIPINQNVNLIKYSDDGEIKFGIIRTLRSINIDFMEKELDQLAKEPIISKIDQPKIQILYESSQHDVQSANNEVQSHQSRQSRQSKSSGNQQFLSGQFKEIKVEQSILQMHAKQILPKQIGWLKIIKQVIFVTIFCLSCSLFLKGDVTHLILQICNILAIYLYQVSIFQNFQILGLEVKLSFREILAWSLLIIFPVSALYLINELQLNNLSFIAWLSIFLTSENISHATRNAKIFGPYLVILSLGSFLY